MSEKQYLSGKCKRWDIDQKSEKCPGKILSRKSVYMLTAHFLGLFHCLVALCMPVCHAVKYDVGNHNLGNSAAKSWQNVGEFHSFRGCQPVCVLCVRVCVTENLHRAAACAVFP